MTMTDRSFTVVVLVSIVGASACVPGLDWRSVQTPALRKFQPVEPRRVVLANGLVLFLQEDHELPFVNATAHLRGGGNDEPADKVGLVSVFGDVWRTGGSRARTGDELDDYLEVRAAKVETSADDDSVAISFSCLKGDLDDVFAAWLEVMRTPAFREDKIALAKAQMATAIARRNDSVRQIAAREARKLAFGSQSALARQAEYATLRAITRADLVAWHAASFHPNRMIVALAGDFDAAQMEARLRAAFESMPRGPDYKKPDLAIAEPKAGVFLVTKNDVNQSSISAVHLGTTKRDPNYYAITVLNEVFGAGFSSRLFSALRTKKGLAYGVGGGIGADYDHVGVTRLGIGTKSRTTVAAIRGLLEELDRLKREPPTAEEIDRARGSILNSFVFKYDSRWKVLQERVVLEFYGYPADFLARFRAGVERVTAAELATVARTYFHKDRFRILVVGKPADFDAPLSTLGPVTNVDIRIPPP